jgi:glycerol-3-phosphate acyltransferase PlsY
MRAAGFWVGLLTATTDIGKGTLAVWLAGQVVPDPLTAWAMVTAGLGVIVGHNYPIWLGFKGGAGGAPATGAAIAIWPWLAPLAVLQGAFILYFIGYASIATIMTAVTSTIVFAILAYAVNPAILSPEFIVFGVGSILLLAWALRPNFDRLLRGEERLVGRRAKKRRQVEAGPSED